MNNVACESLFLFLYYLWCFNSVLMFSAYSWWSYFISSFDWSKNAHLSFNLSNVTKQKVWKKKKQSLHLSFHLSVKMIDNWLICPLLSNLMSLIRIKTSFMFLSGFVQLNFGRGRCLLRGEKCLLQFYFCLSELVGFSFFSAKFKVTSL